MALLCGCCHLQAGQTRDVYRMLHENVANLRGVLGASPPVAAGEWRQFAVLVGLTAIAWTVVDVCCTRCSACASCTSAKGNADACVQPCC